MTPSTLDMGGWLGKMGQQREAEIGEAAGGESERVREREQWKEEREREQNRKRHAQREAALGPDLPQVPAQRLLGWLMLLFSVSRSHWCCSLSLCLQVSLGGSRSCLGEGMASAHVGHLPGFSAFRTSSSKRPWNTVTFASLPLDAALHPPKNNCL